MKKNNLFKRAAAGFSAALVLFSAQAQFLQALTTSAEAGKNIKNNVLLIQDNIPWNSSANSTVLQRIGANYDQVTTTEFLSVKLEDYAVVIFSNDQKFATYQNYAEFKDYMETYAKLGGVIIFGASDGGWANGNMDQLLPGNVAKTRDLEYYNYVADIDHPVIEAKFSDGDGAAVEGKNDPLWYSTYCSHSSFVESSLPAGSNVLVRATNTNAPTLVEYPLGKGRVIASGLTTEYSFAYKDNYAKKILDDLFLYALRVSNFDGADVKQLTDYRLNANQHHIIVASAKTKDPIAGATVKIGDKEYVTDESGKISVDIKGSQRVTVSKKGFMTTVNTYNLLPRKAHIFYLKEGGLDGKPYAILASETNKKKDLLTQKVFFDEGNANLCNVTVEAEWNGNTPGKFEIFQYGGKSLTSRTGKFTFAPGKYFDPQKGIYLRITAENGKTSSPVRLMIDIREGTKNDEGEDIDYTSGYSSNFEIAPDRKGDINDSDYTKVFPNDFESQFTALPIKIVGQKDDDAGTYTVQFLIGVDGTKIPDAAKAKSAAAYFKSFFTEAAERAARGQAVDHAFYEAYCKGYVNFCHANFKPDFSPKLDASGFYEIVYDNHHNVVSKGGGLMINVGGSYTHEHQFLAGPIPLYVKLTAGVELETVMKMILNMDGSGADFNGSATIKLTGAVSGGLGVAGLATVGVGGGLEFDIGLAPEFTGDFTARAFLEAYIVFVLDWQFNLAQKKFHWWPSANERSLSQPNVYSSPEDEDKLNYIDTDYISKTSQWNSAGGAGYNILQSNILPSTLPQIIETTDGTKLMVWQTTDSSKELINSTRLVYSVCKNGVWSEPKFVCENEGADLVCRLVSDGDKIRLIWQKQNAAIEADNAADAAVKAIKSTDIFAAEWNGTEFTDVQCIANLENCDMLPVIAAEGDKMTAVWVNSNDPVNGTGKNIIMTSELVDGKWSEPAQAAEIPGYITYVNAAYINNKLCIVYNAENKLYTLNNGSAVEIGIAGVSSGIVFNSGKIYFENGGKLCFYDPATGKSEEADGSISTLTANFKMSEDGTTIIWHDGASFNVSIFANGKWSAPDKIEAKADTYVQNFDAILTNGKYSIVMNAKDASSGDVSLVDLEGELIERIEIEYASVITDPITNEQTAVIKVVNRENSVIKSLDIKLTDGNVTLVDKKETVDLAPGESAVFSYPINASKVTKVTEFTFSVSDDDVTADTNVTVGKTDISVNVESYYVDNDVILAIKLSNNSNTPANAAVRIIEDSEDGIQLDVKNAGVLSADEDYLILENISMDNIDFDENGVKYFFVKAESLEADADNTNNVVAVAVYKNEDQPVDGDPDITEEIDVTDEEKTPEASEETSETSPETSEASSETSSEASSEPSTSEKTASANTGVEAPTTAIAVILIAAAAAFVVKIRRVNEDRS